MAKRIRGVARRGERARRNAQQPAHERIERRDEEERGRHRERDDGGGRKHLQRGRARSDTPEPVRRKQRRGREGRERNGE